MRLYGKILCLLGMLAAFPAFSEDYVITSNRKADGEDKFAGLAAGNFTSNIPIPEGGLTAEDNLTVEGFYDIARGTNVSVNTFHYISSGVYGNAFSFYGNYSGMPVGPIVIQAREAIFEVQYNNQPNDYGQVYNPDNDDIRPVPSINVNTESVELKIAKLETGTVYIGQSYIKDPVLSLTLSAYDDNTPSYYKFSAISLFYGSANQTGTVTINKGATVDSGSFNTSGSGDGTTYTYTTSLNINGGTLNIGSFSYNRAGDNFTLTHSNGGTLGATQSYLVLGLNGNEGVFNYVVDGLARFNTNGNSIEIQNGVNLMKGSNGASVEVVGGGSMTFACDVSAIDGTISVKDGSTLKLSSWAGNASAVEIGAGSVVSVAGDIALDSSSSIVISVDGADSFGKLSSGGAFVGDDFGKLTFVVDGKAFESGNSLEISLEELVSGSGIDWSKFNIDSNVDFSLGSNSITFVVPEPSHVALAIGALALAFAAYRRRK